MSKEDGKCPAFYSQEYQGRILVSGTIARVVDLSTKDLNTSLLRGSSFAISLRNDKQKYHNERVGRWIEEKQNETIRMMIDLPFPEQPTNYLITLISQADEKDLVSFEAETY